MNILALDTATVTGWAGIRNGYLESGIIDSSIRLHASKTMPADHPGERFSLFENEVYAMVPMYDLVVYERIVGGIHAGGNTTLIQRGLEALVLMCCARYSKNGIPNWSFAAGSIKKWATGSGLLNRESKAQMLALAIKEWPAQKVADDNQADALWMLDLCRNAWEATDPKVTDPRKYTNDMQTALANKVTKIKWDRK